MLLTNSYVFYIKFHIILNSKLLSHYDFIKKIALTWTEQDLYWLKEKSKSKKINIDTPGVFNIRTNRKQCSDVSTVSGISCIDASSSSTNQKAFNQQQKFTPFYQTINMLFKHSNKTVSNPHKEQKRKVSMT